MQPRAQASLSININCRLDKLKHQNIVHSYEEDHNNNSLKASISLGRSIKESENNGPESDCSLEDLYEIGQRMTKHHADKLKKYETDLDSIKSDPSGYINSYFDTIETKLKGFIGKANENFDKIQSEIQISKQECIASIQKCLADFENVNTVKSNDTQQIISTLQYQLESLKRNLFLNKDYELSLNDNFEDFCSFNTSPAEIAKKDNKLNSNEDSLDPCKKLRLFATINFTSPPIQQNDKFTELKCEDETIIGVFDEDPFVTINSKETKAGNCGQYSSISVRKERTIHRLNTLVNPIFESISSKVYSAIQLFYFIKPVRQRVLLASTDGDYKSELVAIQRIFYATYYLIDSALESIKHLHDWEALKSYETLKLNDLLTLLIDDLDREVSGISLSDLFSGQINKTIKNVTTGKVGTEVKNSFYSLDVKVEKYSNLDEYLNDLFKDKTSENDDQNKVIENVLLPEVLAFNLQRDKSQKNRFSFPVDINLAKYSIDKKITEYKLLSLIADEHYCEKNCQHKEHNKYVLYADDRLDDVWYKCTEGFITTCVRDYIIENSLGDACLLVYINAHNTEFNDRKQLDIPRYIAQRFSSVIEV